MLLITKKDIIIMIYVKISLNTILEIKSEIALFSLAILLLIKDYYFFTMLIKEFVT